MRLLPMKAIDGRIEIQGLPTDSRLVQLRTTDDSRIPRLLELALHAMDLRFVVACLDELEGMPQGREVVRQALWRSALLGYFKCFGTGVRGQLHPDEVFEGDYRAAKPVFDYFKDLRNKHLAHDVNAYQQVIPVGIISGTVVEPNCITIAADTSDSTHLKSFRNLVLKTLESVEAEFDELVEVVGTGLTETVSLDDLLSRASPEIRVPKAEDVGRPRAGETKANR